MTLTELLAKLKRLLNISGTTHDTFLTEAINDGQQDFANEANWKFLEKRGSISSVQYQYIYSLASDFDVLQSITYEGDRLFPITWNQMKALLESDSYGKPHYYCVHEGKLYLYPSPNENAPTTALDGDINATVTTITLDSVADLEDKGRIIIGTEVISYQYVDSTNKQIKICTRAEEGTTAATHSDNDTVTFRNIEYDYFKFLSDLSAGTETSEIPARFHDALILFAASRWYEKLATPEDRVLANDFRQKYEIRKAQALRDLGEKQVQKFTTTLEDTVSSPRWGRDETYPENGSLTKI